MSFYQKYRPKRIADLDLTSVREALQSILATGKVSHAYLFVGPRGAGKTSTARILAQIVNCKENEGKETGLSEPCGKCDACQTIIKGSAVDVIEIDAASNGLVDDIRDLREKVRLSPVQLKKKVYIIDEVHMVSTAGFNALLKTLEEPPEHALFILCTTESQKVPETIVSRCARVNFTKGNLEEVVQSLKKAVVGEGLDADDMVLGEIAAATDGSFREGHKLLEQLSTYDKKIDEILVAEVLGVAGRGPVKKLIEATVSQEAKEIIKMFEQLEKTGTKAPILVGSLLTVAKEEMEKTFNAGGNPEIYLKMMDALIGAADRIKMSPLPLLPLEIALLSLCGDPTSPRLRGAGVVEIATVSRGDSAIISPRNDIKGDDNNSKRAGASPAPTREMNDGVVKENVNVEMRIKGEENVEEIKLVTQNYDGPLASFEKIKMEWLDFLNGMAASNGSLAGMLRLVSPIDLQGKSLTLSVTSRFQQDMLEREVKKKIIEEQMAKVWGPMTFKCVLGDSPRRTEPAVEDENVTTVPTDTALVRGAMSVAEEIFGN